MQLPGNPFESIPALNRVAQLITITYICIGYVFITSVHFE